MPQLDGSFIVNDAFENVVRFRLLFKLLCSEEIITFKIKCTKSRKKQEQ
jgi:hypothetical protein